MLLAANFFHVYCVIEYIDGRSSWVYKRLIFFFFDNWKRSNLAFLSRFSNQEMSFETSVLLSFKKGTTNNIKSKLLANWLISSIMFLIIYVVALFEFFRARTSSLQSVLIEIALFFAIQLLSLDAI